MKDYLTMPPVSLDKRKSKDITQQNWVDNMRIKIVSNIEELGKYFRQYTFSYLITFDCDIYQIETVKAYLRR